MNHRASARHTAWILLAALVLGILPGKSARSPLMPCPASQSERSQDERGEELAAVEGLKACLFRRETRQGLPTRGWLVLRVPRPSTPRVQTRPLEHEDPRRVLIPLRIDPPPDDLA
ncbi:MAG: hypothetical protein ACJ8AT_34875 [Hyalangium sp.]|uniref:hypothetical protein n=1 Tax=Hyalangium sp. TaxID=2028555 RepID=UPI00389A534B